MPSTTQTALSPAAAAEATWTLPLTGRATPPPASGLLIEPLSNSGALNHADYPRLQLTPAIGIQFGKETQLKKVLQLPAVQRDALLRDLAFESESFVLRACLFFSSAASCCGKRGAAGKGAGWELSSKKVGAALLYSSSFGAARWSLPSLDLPHLATISSNRC